MSLKEKYENEVKPYMMKKFGYKNVMQVPKVVKVTLNRGLGEALQNQGLLKSPRRNLRS